MTKKFCISLLIITLTCGCDPIDSRLTIYNKTNKTVVPYILLWTSNEEEYDEINLNSLPDEFKNNPIPPNSKKSILIKGDWDLYFENDTLTIFI